ncbi:uncharacterized protein [Porites lutea]|uniref:uncharacterized protein n=1 Tax=Porites lutea TaxID=51062 RepID=UPI003CC5A794
MRYPLAWALAVTSSVLFLGTNCVFGQFSSVVTQGVRVKRVGCFKEDPAKRSINTLLFSDLKSIRSTAKVDFKNFGRYTQGLISRCGAAAAAKSFLFFAINNIGECYSGKASTTYASKGSSTDCKNGGGTKCTGTTQDCVGGSPKSNYVYKLEKLPKTTKPTAKPTTKPGGTTTKPTTQAGAAKLNTLTCQNYLVAIKITAGASAGKPQVPTPAGASPKRTAKGQSTRPTVATPTTKATPSPQSSIENKVRDIYKGYSCLGCLKTVNASSSTVFLVLKFACQGQHLKKLVAGLGASNIIKAECYPPACAYSGSMYPCTSPCGMSTCSMSPSVPYPQVCQSSYPAPAPYPAPVPPPVPSPRCPMSCPSLCAPACSSFCCRSLIGYKNKTGISAKKSSTFNADDFEDDDDDDEDDDDDVEDSDDNDFDETS